MIEHRAMKERQRIKEEQEKKENMTATKVNNKLMCIEYTMSQLRMDRKWKQLHWNLKNVTTSLMTLYNDIHREMADILAILFHP